MQLAFRCPNLEVGWHLRFDEHHEHHGWIWVLADQVVKRFMKGCFERVWFENYPSHNYRAYGMKPDDVDNVTFSGHVEVRPYDQGPRTALSSTFYSTPLE